jgi:hypothetical protein
MKKALLSLSVVLIVRLMSLAQDGTVSTPQNSQIGDRISIATVTLKANTGAETAYVYLPKKPHQPVPGIVFSHSQIRYDDGTTDLTPLAKRVAEAGAAIIVVVRTLTWPARDDRNLAGGEFSIAALHWLLTNANVDPKRCAYVGPKFRDPADPSHLRTLEYQDGIRPVPWVVLGELHNATTDSLKTPDGEKGVEQFLRKTLKLSEVPNADNSLATQAAR